tara:strand:- start:3544 stop:4668 length:1125 start_codon:yes stop_codon:yes gene_type:complete
MNTFFGEDYSEHRKVLVIPNITNIMNIDNDSFVDVIYNHIHSLDQHGDYFWNIILPIPCGRLNLPNVKQHIIGIGRYHTLAGDMIYMRTIFPKQVIHFLKTIEYDVVYSHLPDWYQVKRYTDKPIIGYSHWWEMKTSNPEDRKNQFRNIPVEIIGALNMDVCYLNTEDQKERVVREAKQWFNDSKVAQLEDTLRVWHLGVPEDKIVDKPKKKEKRIVFPHRPAGYKGYRKFIELMEEYREQRQDFVVWVPQLDEEPPHDWIDNTRVSKNKYYQGLQQCVAGVQMRQNNYGWSISATDCMMNGTPMVFQESKCYREIDPDGMFWKYKKSFFNYMDRLLDDEMFRSFEAQRSIDRALELHENEQKMITELHERLGG